MFRVTIWGSRGGIPVSGSRFARYGGATTCLEIEYFTSESQTQCEQRILIDCGSGLGELGKVWGDRRAEALILQTHYHWDHIQGFPFFGHFYNPSASFEFWGVTRDGMTIKSAFSNQMVRPYFPITLDFMPANLEFRTIEKISRQKYGALTIEWTELIHPSGSTAFRVSDGKSSVVFSGDVEVKMGCRERLLEFARGADLMVMDAQYFPEEYASRQGFGHSTVDDAVGIAREGGIGQLVLTHHDGTHNDGKLDSKQSLARQLAAEDVNVHNAFDGMQLTTGGSSLKSPTRSHS